jgi:hypothetical protein
MATGATARQQLMAADLALHALPGLAFLGVLLVLTRAAAADRDWYSGYMLHEDGPIERLTAICLLLGSLVALATFMHLRPRGGGICWFFAACAGLLLLGCLEELSWGQHLLGLESPWFFQQFNRQKEINAHNILDVVMRNATGIRHITSTDLIGVLLLIFGLLLPLMKRLRWSGGSVLAQEWLRLPPVALVPVWILGLLLCLIPPVPRGREHAELFWAAGLLLFMVYESRAALQRS